MGYGDDATSFWAGYESSGTYNGASILAHQLTSATYSLTGLSAPRLVFSSWYQTQDEGTTTDMKSVWISANEGPFTLLGYVGGTGTSGKWMNATASLTPYAGQSIRLRFDFQPDLFNNAYRGWYIDNVRLFQDDDADLLSYADELRRGASPTDSDSDNDGTTDFGDRRTVVEDLPPTWTNGTGPNAPEGPDVVLEIHFNDLGYADARVYPPQDSTSVEGVDMALYLDGTVGGASKQAYARESLMRDPSDGYYIGRFPTPINFDGGTATDVTVVVTLKDVRGNAVAYSGEFAISEPDFPWSSVSLGGFQRMHMADINKAPYPASNSDPADNAQLQGSPVTVKWVGSDPDSAKVKSTVYLGTDPNNLGVMCTVTHDSGSQASCNLGSLQYETWHYWQVKSEDSYLSTMGPIWKFRTISEPCQSGCGGGTPPPECNECGINNQAVQELIPGTGIGTPRLLEQVLASEVVRKYTFSVALMPIRMPVDEPLVQHLDPSGPVSRLADANALDPELLVGVLELRSFSVGPRTQALFDYALLNRLWEGAPNNITSAVTAEWQSFVYGSDSNGHIIGDTIAGILVYGDLRDVVLGAYEGDDVKFMLGLVGLGMTAATPLGDGFYSGGKATIKSIKGAFGRTMSQELKDLLLDAVTNRESLERVQKLASYIGSDAIKAARFQRYQNLFVVPCGGCPVWKSVREIARAEDFEALDMVLGKYGDDVLMQFNKPGLGPQALLKAANAERLLGKVSNIPPELSEGIVRDVAKLSDVPRVGSVLNRLGAMLDARMYNFAKGHAGELRKAAMLHNPPASLVQELNRYITFPNFVDASGNVRPSVRLDVDAQHLEGGQVIFNELKTVKELTLHEGLKNQVLKLKRAVDDGRAHKARIIVSDSTAVPTGTGDYARSKGIDIFRESNLNSPIN